MSLASRGFATPSSRDRATERQEWRHRAELWHSGAVALVLAAALVLFFAHGIDGGPAAGGALLLVGGALSGVPHGSSDFVVAHRVFAARLGAAWLPLFGIAYLAIVAVMMLCWWLAPLATLLGFLVLSGLHFASGDLGPTGRALPGVRWTARAMTPLVPMILCHPQVLAPYMAALGGTDDGTILHGIAAVGPGLLVVWVSSVAVILLRDGMDVLSARSQWTAALPLLELGGLALAAVILPPLLTFAIYFCVIHAIRHMLELAHNVHPRSAPRARALVLHVLGPSSVVCLIGLAVFWDGLGGSLSTPALIVVAIRIVAALTVPHMMLEFVAEHERSRVGRVRSDA